MNSGGPEKDNDGLPFAQQASYASFITSTTTAAADSDAAATVAAAVVALTSFDNDDEAQVSTTSLSDTASTTTDENASSTTAKTGLFDGLGPEDPHAALSSFFAANGHGTATSSPSIQDSHSSTDSNSMPLGGVLALAIVLPIVSIAILLCLVVCLRRRKKRRNTDDDPLLSEGRGGLKPTPMFPSAGGIMTPNSNNATPSSSPSSSVHLPAYSQTPPGQARPQRTYPFSSFAMTTRSIPPIQEPDVIPRRTETMHSNYYTGLDISSSDVVIPPLAMTNLALADDNDPPPPYMPRSSSRGSRAQSMNVDPVDRRDGIRSPFEDPVNEIHERESTAVAPIAEETRDGGRHSDEMSFVSALSAEEPHVVLGVADGRNVAINT